MASKWNPDESDLAFAVLERPDLDLDLFTAKFKAKHGNGRRTRSSWSGKWREWLRTERASNAEPKLDDGRVATERRWANTTLMIAKQREMRIQTVAMPDDVRKQMLKVAARLSREHEAKPESANAPAKAVP